MDDAIKSVSETETKEANVAEKTQGTARNQYPDRLKVSAEALNRLNLWINQVTENLRGVKLSRSEFVNFLILNHEESLSSSELKELELKYFDEVKFAHWALEELKLSKSRGESMTLADILSHRKTTLGPKQRSRKSEPNSSQFRKNPKPSGENLATPENPALD